MELPAPTSVCGRQLTRITFLSVLFPLLPLDTTALTAPKGKTVFYRVIGLEKVKAYKIVLISYLFIYFTNTTQSTYLYNH